MSEQIITQTIGTTQEGQLEKVENHQEWKEGVKMYIKGIAPFHIMTTRGHQYQVLVGEKPGREIQKLTLFQCSTTGFEGKSTIASFLQPF